MNRRDQYQTEPIKEEIGLPVVRVGYRVVAGVSLSLGCVAMVVLGVATMDDDNCGCDVMAAAVETNVRGREVRVIVSRRKESNGSLKDGVVCGRQSEVKQRKESSGSLKEEEGDYMVLVPILFKLRKLVTTF
ncbi:hypothetical protein ACFE04_011216 [Oxalis oulophora]